MKKQDIILLSAILLGLVFIRVFFQIPNFNPLGAVALMGGLLFSSKVLRWIVPIGALLVGDLILSFSSPTYLEYILSIDFLFVYASFFAIIGLGTYFSKNPNLTKVLGGSILAAVAFFIISNAGSWITMPEYSKDFSGLLASYGKGLPFFRGTLISQVLFSVGIYAMYSLATNRKLVFAK